MASTGTDVGIAALLVGGGVAFWYLNSCKGFAPSITLPAFPFCGSGAAPSGGGTGTTPPPSSPTVPAPTPSPAPTAPATLPTTWRGSAITRRGGTVWINLQGPVPAPTSTVVWVAQYQDGHLVRVYPQRGWPTPLPWTGGVGTTTVPMEVRTAPAARAIRTAAPMHRPAPHPGTVPVAAPVHRVPAPVERHPRGTATPVRPERVRAVAHPAPAPRAPAPRPVERRPVERRPVERRPVEQRPAARHPERPLGRTERPPTARPEHPRRMLPRR
jgi:hypothetical protein